MKDRETLRSLNSFKTKDSPEKKSFRLVRYSIDNSALFFAKGQQNFRSESGKVPWSSGEMYWVKYDFFKQVSVSHYDPLDEWNRISTNLSWKHLTKLKKTSQNWKKFTKYQKICKEYEKLQKNWNFIKWISLLNESCLAEMVKLYIR